MGCFKYQEKTTFYNMEFHILPHHVNEVGGHYSRNDDNKKTDEKYSAVLTFG